MQGMPRVTGKIFNRLDWTKRHELERYTVINDIAEDPDDYIPVRRIGENNECRIYGSPLKSTFVVSAPSNEEFQKICREIGIDEKDVENADCIS